MGAVRVMTGPSSPDYLSLNIADVHETHRELVERFRTAGACSADRVIEIDVGTLSSDERRLFDDFVRRGVIVAWRGGHYLDERALTATDRPAVRRAILGAVLVLALMGGLIWVFRR